MNDPAGQCFSIAEVLRRIFEQNDLADNARCARVCKTWGETSLDIVWEVLDNPKPLLQLLAPLKRRRLVGENENLDYLKFDRDLQHRDWKRFALYSRRVKSITLRNISRPGADPARAAMVDKSVFMEMARTRPAGDILPNLKEFVLADCDSKSVVLRYAALFLHEGVRAMSLVLPGFFDRFTDVEQFFEDLSSRCPELSHISVVTYFPVRIIESSLVHLLSNALRLKELFVSSCTLTPTIVSTLATLPNLEVVGSVGSYQLGRDVNDILFRNRPKAGSEFPKLALLHIQGQLGLLSSNCFPSFGMPNLRELVIDMVYASTPKDFGSCLQTLTSGCPLLEALVFSRSERAQAGLGDVMDLVEVAPITARILRRLQAFSNLRAFVLVHSCPVLINDEELIDLLSGCKAMQKLLLNCEPTNGAPSSLTLGVLSKLAELPNSITHIGLYVDGTITAGLPGVDHPARLAQLQVISFGNSPFADAHEVALYLSRVLPACCEMDVETHLSEAALDHIMLEQLDEMEERRMMWEEVKTLLHVLIRARMEERQIIEDGELQV